MTAYLVDLCTTIGLYALMAISYLGWGLGASRVLRLKSPSTLSPFTLVWLGWCASLFLLQILHLLVPVAMGVSVLVFAAGIAQLILFRRQIKSGDPWRWRRESGYAVFLLIVTVWVASRSMLEPVNYDSGLYHFNSIRWVNTYAIIPGLGNLHNRLGFNQSFFVYVASLNFFPFFGQGRCLANSFLFLLLFAELLRKAFIFAGNLSRAREWPYSQYVSSLLMLPVLLLIGLRTGDGLSSPTPDLACSLLQILMFLLLHEILAERFKGRMPEDKLVILSILAATITTVKLSNVVFAGCVCAIGLAVCLLPRMRRESYRQLPAVLARFAAPAVLVLAVWAVRGFIMTGAPLFPSTLGWVPVSWAVPKEEAQSTANWVYSWARGSTKDPDEVLGNWNWLGPWLYGARRQALFVVPVITGVVFLVLAALMLAVRKRQNEILNLWPMLIPVLAGLAFWFLTAPNPRFAHSLFWLFEIVMILIFLEQVRAYSSRWFYVGFVFVALILSQAYFIKHNKGIRDDLENLSITGYSAAKVVEFNRQITLSGLEVYVPKVDNRSWDSSFITTPYFNPNLRLRGETIRQGFTVNP